MYKAFLSDGGHILYSEKGSRIEKTRQLYDQLVGMVGERSPSFEAFSQEYFRLRQLHHTVPNFDLAGELARLMGSFGWLGFEQKKQTKAWSLELRQGVKDTLEVLLCKCIPFVVLSDAPMTSQKMIEWYGHYFRNEHGQDLVTRFITSLDLGVMKPDTKFFNAGIQEIKRHLKVDIREIAFIGHDIDEITGAKAYGLDTVAVYVAEQELPLITPHATHLVQEFSDILRLV